ncbi:MAG: phosphoglucosamine mutase [Betaproteobacteria bacterium]
MTRKYFGTDGVRGKVGVAPVTPEIIMHLGYAAGKVLAGAERSGGAGDPPAVLIGKDTRISGYMLESALQAGLSAAGVDIYLSGPLPTPAVAYLTRALRLQAGIVISASHNAFEDNGIKFFSASGNKLPDAVEQEIERGLQDPITTASSAGLGKARRINDAAGRYIEFCKSTFPSALDLRGIKIVVDCANGACYQVAPHVFHELGADVIAVGNRPDGLNINRDCGATSPQTLVREVKASGAHLGIALDGDGDRLVMADGSGRLYDGDELLYIIACHRQAEGALRGGVVGTLMSNFGMEQALRERDIPFVRAAVGDRYVLEKLQEVDWLLGGENSGHIICLDKHTTGDGIVSALQVLHVLRVTGQSLEQVCAKLTLYPQVLINVKVAKGDDPSKHPRVRSAVSAAETRLQGRGRVLLRASGTEPVVRVMVEGESELLVNELAQSIAASIQAG